MKNRDIFYIAAGIIILYVIKKGASTVSNSVSAGLDITSPHNIFYSETNKIGASISGKPNFDFGVWIYDITHGIK